MTYHTFAAEYGWTPEQVDRLTIPQIRAELIMIRERRERERAEQKEMEAKIKRTRRSV